MSNYLNDKQATLVSVKLFSMKDSTKLVLFTYLEIVTCLNAKFPICPEQLRP